MAGLEMKYFVLNPASSDKAHAEASRAAMAAYADYMQCENHQLAVDLMAWVSSCYAADQKLADQARYTAEKAFAESNAKALVARPVALDHEGADIRQERPTYLPGMSDEELGLQRGPHAGDMLGVDEGADIRQTPPPNLLEAPPEGWFVERDPRTQNPTGYLTRTEDGIRKWYTDPMFKKE